MNGSNTSNVGRAQLLEPYWVNMYASALIKSEHVPGAAHVPGTRHDSRERAEKFAGSHALYRLKVTPKHV